MIRAERSRETLGYVPALDGLRGIAILLVVTVHYFGLPFGGVLGVDLFFVLSGFLITTLLLEEIGDTGRLQLGAFYLRRARRLFPALGAMLVGFVVLGGSLKVAALGGLYFGNIVQAFDLSHAVTGSPLTSLWSLAEEEQFYLLWPPALLLLLRRSRPVTILATLIVALIAYRAALVVHGATQMRIDFGPDTHADGLAAGALLALIRIRRGGLVVPDWVWKTAGVTLLVLVILRPDGTGFYVYGLPVAELAGVGMVAGAVARPDLSHALAWRPLVSVGRISYSLYVWHLLVIWAAVKVGIGSPAVDLVVALTVASLSYRFVEQPFRRRRRVTTDSAAAYATP